MDRLRGYMDDAYVRPPRPCSAPPPPLTPGCSTHRKAAVSARMGTETERKIDEALSNKNWGASSTLLNEIAQITYD